MTGAEEGGAGNDAPEAAADGGTRPGGGLERLLSHKAGLVIGALACNLLWGSAVPLVGAGYDTMGIGSAEAGSQMLYAGVRFFLAGLVILALWGATHRRSPLVDRRGAIDSLKLCLTWTVGQYAFYYLGIAHATGVSASLIQGFEVFVALVVGALVFHTEKITARKVAGCLVGIGGLVLFNWGGAMGFSLMGEGLLVVGTVFAAVASVLLSRYAKDTDPVLLAGTQFVMGGAVLAAMGLGLGGRLSPASPVAWGVLAWLVMVSAVAYTVWSILLAIHPVSSVVVFGFTLPVFGVVVSLLVLGDQGHPLTALSVTAVAILCLGIWLVDSVGRGGRRSKADGRG